MNNPQKKCECECHWCTRNPPAHNVCNWSCSAIKLSSPTQPDTESWEGEFDRKYVSAYLLADEKPIKNFLDSIKSFIRQEKEKSYGEGWNNYQLMSREKRLSGGITKDFEDGRHSAYREIIEIVEEEKSKSFSVACKFTLTRILSRLKEKLQ